MRHALTCRSPQRSSSISSPRSCTARVAAKARRRPSRAGSSTPTSSATIRTACFACRVSRLGRDGTLRPNTAPTIVFDSDTIAIVDGNRGFGQVTGEFADEARHREGAREGHRDDRPAQLRTPRTASATGRTWRRRRGRCRCTSSTRRARSASRRSAAATAGCRPIRSRSACRSTARDPVVLDITTSMVAEGKLMVALNKGEHVPEGWIVDKDGAPTTEPEGLLRRRRAAHHRRAQGLGAVDRHRSPRRRGVDRQAAPIPTIRSCATTCCRSTSRPRSTMPTAASRAKRGASSIS